MIPTWCVVCIITRRLMLTFPTAPNNDELTAVPPANVNRHVESSSSRSDHSTEPATRGYGPPSQRGLPERTIQGDDVRNLSSSIDGHAHNSMIIVIWQLESRISANDATNVCHDARRR